MSASGVSLEERIKSWDGLGIVSRFDQETGTWIFIALHDNTLGPNVGGTRMKEYETPDAGLLDAMRLGEGMTFKWAALRLRCGGGKAVLAISRPLQGDERDGLLCRYARLVEGLHGTFQTGRDLGTTDADMLTISRETRYVHGVDFDSGSVRDPGPYTAVGVHHAIRATARQLFGSDDLSGRRVLVQGAGDVGAPLARLLADDGVRLLVSDLDEALVGGIAGEVGAEVVAPEAAIGTACDIFAPCAVGGTINKESITRLNCRAVCGSANNQLGEPGDADLLHDRDILYAPDFIANGGGAMAFWSIHQGVNDETRLQQDLAGIDRLLAETFSQAAAAGESPLRRAQAMVQQTLREARESGGA